MVQPRRGKWIVFRLGDDEVLHTFQRLGGARARARVLAGELEVAFFVIGPAGSISDRVAAPKRKPEAAETKAEPKKAKVEPAKPAAKAKVEPAKPAAKAKAEPAKPAAKAKTEPAKPAAKAKAEPKKAKAEPAAKAKAEPAKPAVKAKAEPAKPVKAETPKKGSAAPPEIKIVKKGSRFALIVMDSVVATATTKARATSRAARLLADPDFVSKPGKKTARKVR
jgi:hypothetical protein